VVPLNSFQGESPLSKLTKKIYKSMRKGVLTIEGAAQTTTEDIKKETSGNDTRGKREPNDFASS
jgi:hypothetical protein